MLQQMLIQIFYWDVCGLLPCLNLQRERSVSVSLLAIIGRSGTGNLQKSCLYQEKLMQGNRFLGCLEEQPTILGDGILCRKEGACSCSLANCSPVRDRLFPRIQIEQEGAVVVLVEVHLFWLPSVGRATPWDKPHGEVPDFQFHCQWVTKESTIFLSANDSHLLILDLTRESKKVERV